VKDLKIKKKSKPNISVPGFKCIHSRENISEYELVKNKLRILYAHVPGSPTVTTNIVYHIGSQHEGRGETGLAHMLEHMLFKPTSGVGVTWKDLEEKGAHLNATTWLDRTLYYFNLPTQYLEDMLSVEADRMRGLLLTNKEFLPERSNVLSEYEMYNSRPETALEWHMVATAFESHGYHHDTIGFKSDIESYTIDKLSEFYNRYYWPNNATLIVAGDIDIPKVLNLIKKYFGEIPQRTNPNTAILQKEASQEGVRRVVLERPTPLRLINIAFKAPSFTTREWSALQLGLLHLTLGETSILYKKLVEANLATSVSAHLYPTKDAYLAFIEVYANETTPYSVIEKIVFDAVNAMIKHKLSASEIALLKEFLYSEDLFSRDGTMQIASNLAEYVATGDWKRYFTGLDEIKSITSSEIQSAATKYLTLRQATIGTLNNYF